MHSMAQMQMAHHSMHVYVLAPSSSASQWDHGSSCYQLSLDILHMQSQIAQDLFQDLLLVRLLAQSAQASSAQWSVVL
jgi:hypothetical protein